MISLPSFVFLLVLDTRSEKYNEFILKKEEEDQFVIRSPVTSDQWIRDTHTCAVF